MVLAATPNQHSLGMRRACNTVAIEKESMALMQCPSVLSAPTLNGVFICLQLYIASATHDEEGRCGAGGHPKSTLIRTDTTL